MKWSASFPGTAGYLSAANFTGNPAAFSVSCWVNLASAQVARVFFSDYQPTGSRGWAVGLSDFAGNQIKFYLGSATLISAGALTPGVWAHVVCTHDGATAKIYLGGSPTPDNSSATAVVYGAVPGTNSVGGDPSAGQYLNGSLAAVGYWSKALSAAEVVSLYGGGAGLLASGLSGTLLTSLVAYYDFADSGALGADAGGAGHGMAVTGPVAWSGAGPSGAVYAANSPAPPRPRRRSLAPGWKRGLVVALPLQNESGSAAGVLDAVTGTVRAFVGAPGWANGRWGPELRIDDTRQGGVGVGSPLLGLTEFTVATLCTASLATGGAAGLRQLWCEDTATANIRLAFTTGVFFFQLGSDGAYPNVTAAPQVLNEPVLVTARLTTAGVRSIWYGPYKQAERTDAGAAYPGAGGTLVLGTGATNVARNWAGGVSAAYVWTRALSDAEIVALAADPFAPVRPAPARLGLLSPPSPRFDPVPWLRGATAAPRAARLSVTPASGWAPGLAAAPDLLPWLRRAAAPAPPAPPPRALLAPWSPASGPAPDPLAWLLRAAPAPGPEARAPAAPEAGWRPDFAGGFAPPVRHAMVRFWRGPEAHMPRLEDGEPAWATDTKSLWMGSASGNVRIGP